MSVLAKTIYFPDYPTATSGRSGLTVPFPSGSEPLFDGVSRLSSHAIRGMIGYDSFRELEADAVASQESVAAFVRGLMSRHLRAGGSLDPKDNLRVSLTGTFKGGKGSPLHDWYPYLEGYSPDFVGSVIDNFAPGATSILDPFCGSGTTALTAAGRGLIGMFSEVNPACRFVISAKALAVRLRPERRDVLSAELERLANGLPAAVRKARSDLGLRAAHMLAFGQSEFFDSKTFDQVLRARTLVDAIAADDVELGTLVLMAVVRSLVPASLLIRRGDLRFKTPAEMAKPQPAFLDAVAGGLRLIASDLHDVPLASGQIVHVGDDARYVGKAVPSKVGAVITSPPYLNGTNYFRNTKIELWFLRELDSKSRLRDLRDAAITSGINDVTVDKVNASPPSSKILTDVVEALKADSYDPRIPLMVKGYFAEMTDVVDSIRQALLPNGTVAIDLGDSCYGKVWVPTDEILCQIMEARGFIRLDRVVLRERQSRSGRKLAQTLQVFRLRDGTRGKRPLRKGEAPGKPDGWGAFKKDLPHQKGAMAQRNWGNPIHSLCSYQGKLKPSIASSLIKVLAGPSSRVLDPFSGVGTIPFEARLAGSVAYGFDISPAAVAISRAKIEQIDGAEVAATMAALERRMEKAKLDRLDLEQVDRVRFNGPLSGYFHRRTLAEILAARRYFAEHPPVTAGGALVMSCMLHILHGNRPYALSRNSHPITPFAPTGPTEYRPVYERLAKKVQKSLSALDDVPAACGKIFFQDATTAWPDEVAELTAVITSPPFFDSTRFYSANWMRLWFAGWDPSDFGSRPDEFVDQRQKKSFDVYRPVFSQCAERLAGKGFVLIHLGKSVKCDMARELVGIAGEYLDLVDQFDESIAHCESHGIRDKGTVTHHQYLLLRRR